MKKLLALILALWASCASVSALAQNAFPPVGTMFSTPVAGTVAAITKIISGKAGQRIYLTQLSLHPTATSVVTLSYGTGTNCGTGTTVFYGPATFQNGENAYIGSGAGAIFVVPTANDVCITIATAVAPGWISYAQF